MAYTHSGGLLDYFMPDIPTGTATASQSVLGNLDIGASSSAPIGDYVCIKSCNVKRLQFIVTNEAVIGTATGPTVTFKKYPTPNSTASASTVGVLTIPDGTAIGKCVYKEVDVAFAIGDGLHLSWTVGTGGSVAGQGVAALEAYSDPEAPANNSDMIVSV
jgi:hypothetical protein